MLDWCSSCFGWNRLEEEIEEIDRPEVKLDSLNMGLDAVIVKNGKRLCGTGGVLSNAPILQDKAYFEVKVQSDGVWGCGVASERCDLNSTPLGSDSWTFRSDLSFYAQNDQVEKLDSKTVELNEGDTIGIAYDHVTLQFFINGYSIGNGISGIKGKVYPVVYVDQAAILDTEFINFEKRPPSGFGQIMFEQNIL